MNRAFLCAALSVSLVGLPAVAQSLADLRDDAASPSDVTTYGMGWAQQRYSPLQQINASNVKRLAPVWNLSLNHSGNASVQPLLVDGVMYVTLHDATVAVDALTGRQKWRSPVELPADINAYLCCGIQNRGGAVVDGVLYRTTIDAYVMAISLKDGKTLWKSKAGEYKNGYSMTHAPLIAGNVLVTGSSGGEFGGRGFLTGWDLKSGEKKWHRWTTAAPGEKGGDTWSPGAYKDGGANPWITGTYDPELDLMYWGTSNGGPWNAATRGGDSLYISSVLALRPSTGEIVWHYQFSPGDPYDYDGVNELVLADLPVDGKGRKVLMQANRNGFFYVLDRSTGKLLSAKPFAKKINWASGIDMGSGRPIDTPMTTLVRKTEEMKDFIEVWPSAFGGKNFPPMSFDPKKRIAYFNTINLGMKVRYVKQERPAQPTWYLGLELGGFAQPEDGMRGSLIAWDPVAGKKLWDVPSNVPLWSGVVSTAGGLVFAGALTGEFMAYEAGTGKKLWQFQSGSGITGLPIVWERNGKQYVTVTSGSGTTLYAAFSGDPALANVVPGSSLWTFALQD